MNRNVFAAVLGGACLCATAACAAPPVQAFASLPAIKNVHLSPDGKYFSAIEPVNGRPTVVVFKLNDPSTKPIIFADPGSFAADSRWINNDRLLCIVFGDIKYPGGNYAQHFHQRTRVISVSVSGKDPVVLFKKKQDFYFNSSTAYIVDTDADDPNVVYIGAWQLDEAVAGAADKIANAIFYLNLYKVNVENGDVDLVEKGTQYTQQWLMDGHGHVVARVDESKDLKDSIVVYDHGAERVAETIDVSKGDSFGLEGLSEDGNSIVIRRHANRDTTEIDTIPISASGAATELYSDAAFDMASAPTDDWTGRVVGTRYDTDTPQYHYFDSKLNTLQQQLEKALPGQSVSIGSWDAKRENMIVESEDPQHPRTYWLYNSVSHQLNALATQYPDLQPADLGVQKPYNYKARDGLDIHGYLTLPPGKDPRNLPVVVFPHGGPGARDVLGFDWWAQFMASRGYAVFQPNFRGSWGYGHKFLDAGDGQWGRAMQDDITDGVRKLIADGVADPKRVCIVGASYGGYAALAGATFTPDVYACAVSYAGVSDVPGIIGNVTMQAGEESSGAAYERAHIGDLTSNEAGLQAVSPYLHADQVRVPVLLLHSAKDVTVPIQQSELENAALQKAGKKVSFIAIDGDDHYLNLAATRQRVLEEIAKFLQENIGN